VYVTDTKTSRLTSTLPDHGLGFFSSRWHATAPLPPWRARGRDGVWNTQAARYRPPGMMPSSGRPSVGGVIDPRSVPEVNPYEAEAERVAARIAHKLEAERRREPHKHGEGLLAFNFDDDHCAVTGANTDRFLDAIAIVHGHGFVDASPGMPLRAVGAETTSSHDEPTRMRQQLSDLGYDPIPLRGKKPAADKWQLLTGCSAETIAGWQREHAGATNTGILCKHTPFLDADVKDLKVCNAIWDFVKKRLASVASYSCALGRHRSLRCPSALMSHSRNSP